MGTNNTALASGPILTKVAQCWSFPIKADDFDVSPQGIITGYLTKWNHPVTGEPYLDSYQDIIDEGAFNKTMSDLEQARQWKNLDYLHPHLWQHDSHELIGGNRALTKDTKGIIFDVQLNLKVQRGFEAFELAKAKMQSGISYGYDVVRFQMMDGYKRLLKEIRLWETSSVTFPAHEFALIEGVKSGRTNFYFSSPEPTTDFDDFKAINDDLKIDTEYKTVCGNTSGPIGPRDESWDGAAAEKWIWSQALDKDNKVKPAVAKKYFMKLDGDATLKGSYGYPFWSDGHINVGGVKAVVGALSGARGADAGGDSAGMRKKCETLYNRINKKYPKATPLEIPWKKAVVKDAPDFATLWTAKQPNELMKEFWQMHDTLAMAVLGSIQAGNDDNTSDDIPNDIDTCLTQYGTTLKDEWLPEYIDACTAQDAMSIEGSQGMDMYGMVGYYSADISGRMMKRLKAAIEGGRKSGRVLSEANRQRLAGALSSIQDYLNDLNSLLSETDTTDDTQKHRPPPVATSDFITMVQKALTQVPKVVAPTLSAPPALSIPAPMPPEVRPTFLQDMQQTLVTLR
jgi:HK97 family phage prohead protease